MIKVNVSTTAKIKTLLNCRLQRREYVNFTFIGPPGSGKGTYASLLVERITNLRNELPPVFISASDVLRDTNNEDIQKHQNQGTLVDCDLVGHAVLEKLENNSKDNICSGELSSKVGYFLDS